MTRRPLPSAAPAVLLRSPPRTTALGNIVAQMTRRDVGMPCNFTLRLRHGREIARFYRFWGLLGYPASQRRRRVLDLACGTGRYAIWLAQQGYQVDAIDRNELAVTPMIGMNNIQVKILDLETGRFPTSKDPRYAGIIVCHYLHRPLLPVLSDLLNPGGCAHL